ncbi:porin [Afifella pfennigii]|uniref:porin n=1 Tax=Afifella pfennigii TaxID=209897 RepID=UPI00047DA75C|nr:porin [Afifella pfennigii]
MKLKSLLFGSAAAVMAVTGAQAADLPVAEPVDYVRICDAFGTGFYYIPGTDTCLKVGGRVRVEMHWVSSDPQNRSFNSYTSRARGYVRLDARNQTDFGLLRAYVSMYQTVGPANSTLVGTASNYSGTGPNLENAFLQISNDMGTFTFGHASSFFDFWGTYAWNTRIGMDDNTTEQTLMAYTFNVGNGVSATLSFEDPSSGGRRSSLVADGIYGGQRYPDVVANIRVDQGWGSAQIMGVLHDVRASGPGAAASELGWAIGAGLTVGVPGTAFEFSGQAGYSEGAVAYLLSGSGGYGGIVAGPLTDGFWSPATGLSLTDAWMVRAGVSAEFASAWTASISASYEDIDHPTALGAAADYDLWGVAGNIAWAPVSGFFMGVEASYANVDFGAGGVDTDAWGLMVRGQRTF